MTTATVEHIDTETGEVTMHPVAHDLMPRIPTGLPAGSSSPAIGQLAAALAKAQRQFGAVVKDKKATVKHKEGGGSHSYSYATLAGVLEAVGDALSENGIAYLQPVAIIERGVRVRTLLICGEEWIADDGVVMPVAGKDAQAVGSAITYARRYGLTSLLGIAQEDDDGAAAKSSTQAEPAAKPAAVKTAPKKERDALKARITELSDHYRSAISERLKTDGVVWDKIDVLKIATVASWVDVAESKMAETPIDANTEEQHAELDAAHAADVQAELEAEAEAEQEDEQRHLAAQQKQQEADLDAAMAAAESA